jgi:hypothetical protein
MREMAEGVASDRIVKTDALATVAREATTASVEDNIAEREGSQSRQPRRTLERFMAGCATEARCGSPMTQKP